MKCFVAGTLILTAIGFVAIENVKAGDKVTSTNVDTFEVAEKMVLRTFQNETYELVHVFINNEKIVATPEHPFYVVNKGWTFAKNLTTNTELMLHNNISANVGKVFSETIEMPVNVYNFEVEDFHTYFVGQNSVLVHNASCGADGNVKMGKEDWADYPDGNVPKPKGQLKFLEDNDYKIARTGADKANKVLHKNNLSAKGLDYHEIKPVKFGGSPTDINNKVLLSRSEHMKYTNFWNKIQRTMKFE